MNEHQSIANNVINHDHSCSKPYDDKQTNDDIVLVDICNKSIELSNILSNNEDNGDNNNHTNDICETFTNQDHVKYTINLNDTKIDDLVQKNVPEIDCVQLSRALKCELKQFKVPVSLFATKILDCSQYTLAKMLKNNSTSSSLKMNETTKKLFIQIKKWLRKPMNERKCKYLSLKASLLLTSKSKDDTSTTNADFESSSSSSSYAPFAVIIQKYWRGHRIRRELDQQTPNFSVIRKRLRFIDENICRINPNNQIQTEIARKFLKISKILESKFRENSKKPNLRRETQKTLQNIQRLSMKIYEILDEFKLQEMNRKLSDQKYEYEKQIQNMQSDFEAKIEELKKQLQLQQHIQIITHHDVQGDDGDPQLIHEKGTETPVTIHPTQIYHINYY